MDLSRNAPSANFITHAGQFVKSPLFHRALSFIMYDDRALLCLLVGMATNLYQCVDDPVKSINVVVIDNELFNIGINCLVQNFDFRLCKRLHNNQISV
jgi:hypothetical protein